MDDLPLPDINHAPTGMSFNDKWEHYKNDLAKLYLDGRLALPKIQHIMRENWNFDAEVHQYKYRFDKWGWKKSISSKKKEAILKISERRALQGLDTAVKIQHRSVDVKKIKRFARSQQKGQGLGLFRNMQDNNHQSTSITSRLVGSRIGLVNWDIPFKILRDQAFNSPGHPSPFSPSAPTPSDISICGTPNERSQALTCKTKEEKTLLFLSGKFESLLKVLDQTEQQNLSTWMYQFRHFAFMTAKHWGRGPRFWTASTLWPGDMALSLLPSHQVSEGASIRSSPRSMMDGLPPRPLSQSAQPSDLCSWTIHVLQEDYEALPADLYGASEYGDEPLHNPWPEVWQQPEFSERLSESIKSNSFSTLPTASVPLSISKLSRSIRAAPDEMLGETIRFSIISRNTDLLESLLEKANESEYDLSHLSLLHLAGTYLDGAKTCCHIMHILVRDGLHQKVGGLRSLARNSAGHTVLDSLFLTILRNHSTVPLELVDGSLRGSRSFSGGELDVCGRWDADSECYLSLVSGGTETVPLTWRHKFCNTSIQAVCHSIVAIDDFASHLVSPPSGLFTKRCFDCGAKLELPVVHCLVMVAFCLCENGLENEDLFGIICCLFTLVILQAGTKGGLFEGVELSLKLLLGRDDDGLCSHEAMTPANLAQYLTANMKHDLKDSLKLGWKLFCSILEHIELIDKATSAACQNATCSLDIGGGFCKDCPARVLWESEAPGYAGKCDSHYEVGLPTIFGQHPVLGHIWACAQAEFINHRRITQKDPWTSDCFDKEEMLEALESKSPKKIRLVATGALSCYCACGNFEGCYRRIPCRREEISTEYLSNMDDWSRTSILDDGDVYI